MKVSLFVAACACAFKLARAQQIYDIWQTTWDKSKLLTYTNVNPPINFGSPTVIGDADIVIDDGQTYQSVWGFGGSLTDSSALLLNNLKNTNANSYWELMNLMFNSVHGSNSGHLSFIRVSIGASDFSQKLYSFDDTSGDTSLTNFNINTPSSVFSVLNDINSINSVVKLHLVPWSPPGWMKSSGTMNGGSFQSSYINTYANYLFKAVQGFASKGFYPYSIAIQNEPLNSNPTYPTCQMTYQQEGQIGTALRKLLDSNGFGSVKIIGFEHNWSSASGYPSSLIQNYGSAFAGVAFHCYSGNVAQQDDFHAKFPKSEIYLTECAGTIGSDWWSDIKWYMDNLWIGSIEHNSHVGLMWNLASYADGEPRLPGTNSCGGSGCRALATITVAGGYSLNQEFYSMAQASKATIPRDSGGPWGKRISVSVGGQYSWGLRVSAFVTGRAKSSDWNKYAVVVMNWNDNSGGWNPTPIQTTIEFRGQQARYTFPVGVTTLWWYAPASGGLQSEQGPEYDTEFDAGRFYAQSNGQAVFEVPFDGHEGE